MKQIFIVLFISSIFISCGKTQKQDTPTNTKQEKTKSEGLITQKSNVVVDANGVANVVIKSNDGMRFDIRKIKVKAGQKIRLTLKHTGKLGKKIMGHNVVFLRKNVKLSAFAVKAMEAKDNDYIPQGSKDIIAHTKMIGGGETTSLEFMAPDTGTYDYVCSFPGHYGLMKGKLIVE